MNYYPFHVGDYSAHTAHLTPMEDIAYRRLLDLYYLREGPITGEVESISRLIRMTDDQSTVRNVLQEFFQVSDHLHGKAYQHKRCDLEISRMQDRQNQARAAAARSVEARKQRDERALNGRSTDVQRTLNDRSATNTNTNTNTKHIEKKESKEKTQPLRGAALSRSVPTTKPDDVDDVTWADWTSLRKSKRAPITRTVIDAARGEAEKAGMQLAEFLRVWCLRGSTGLQAAWLKNDEKGTPKSFALQDEANAQARWEEMTGRKWPKGKRGEVVDVEVAIERIEK